MVLSLVTHILIDVCTEHETAWRKKRCSTPVTPKNAQKQGEYKGNLGRMCSVGWEDGKTSQQREKDVKPQRGLAGTAGDDGKDEGRNKANLELGTLSMYKSGCWSWGWVETSTSGYVNTYQGSMEWKGDHYKLKIYWCLDIYGTDKTIGNKHNREEE